MILIYLLPIPILTLKIYLFLRKKELCLKYIKQTANDTIIQVESTMIRWPRCQPPSPRLWLWLDLMEWNARQ